MRENWPRALAFNLAWEGGAAIRPNEPGGAVNKGISLTAYEEWSKRHGRVPPTVDDLMMISDEDVVSFYKERADQIDFDHLPAGYDLLVFNASTMQGINGAKQLDKEADGDLGLFTALHMQKKMVDKNIAKFGKGWAARLVAAYKTAVEIRDGGKTTFSPGMVGEGT